MAKYKIITKIEGLNFIERTIESIHIEVIGMSIVFYESLGKSSQVSHVYPANTTMVEKLSNYE